MPDDQRPRSTYWFPRKLSPRASRTLDPERDVPGRLTRRDDWRLPRAVPRLAVPRLASMPILRARSNPEGDPRQDPAGAGARAVATPAEAICPATSERSKETTRWALTGRLRHSLCGRVRMKMMANAEPIAVRLQKISTGPNPETATRGTARGKRPSPPLATLPGTFASGSGVRRGVQRAIRPKPCPEPGAADCAEAGLSRAGLHPCGDVCQK